MALKGIYKELVRIQQELKAPKNLYNKFGNYKYRNAEGILEAVKPLLNGQALLIDDEPVMIGERYYIKATVTLTDGEDAVQAVAYAREDETKKGMDGCQITGACSSYARKYALNALLMIDDSKDSDDDSLSPKNPANEEKPAGNVSVKVGGKVPEIPKKEPEKKATAETSAVKEYLLSAMTELREARGITPGENNKLFKAQMKALVDGGICPDKKLEEYSMEEAMGLIDAMYKNFDENGTELKIR